MRTAFRRALSSLLFTAAVAGVPALAVASQLGIRVGAVYQARSQVQKLLKELPK